jgi:hypothetical protein
MGSFQLPDGTRLFVKGDSGVEKIAIHKKVKINLRQVEDGAGGTLPAINSSDPNVASLSGISAGRGSQSFTVEAKGDGQATLTGTDNGGTSVVDPLKVVVGDFKYHDTMKFDLIAEAGRSNSGSKIFLVQRLLNNNKDDSNLFNQKSDKNTRDFKTDHACGSVCARSGKVLFGKVEESYFTYHVPLKEVSSRDEVRYREGTINRARQAIKLRLTSGTAVRVGATFRPRTSMLNGGLQPTRSGGHFLLIVGCNSDADKFLYIDPWPDGSTLTYKGGIEAYPDKCVFLGMFILDKLARGPILRSAKDNTGSFSGDEFLEVIAGPM